MILSISVNLCSFSIGRGQIIDVYAEDIATPEFIGYFLVDEPVGGTLKCYIDEEDIPIISRSGRAIFMEKIEDGDNSYRFPDDLYDRYPGDTIDPDIFDRYDHINSIPDDDGDDEVGGLGILGEPIGEIAPSSADTDLDLGYRYYYYAEPNGLGKIVEFKELKNDIDSVVFMINYLYQKAEEYSPNANIIAQTNGVLSYIREMNVSYSSNNISWNLIAGGTDINFIDYVNSDYSHGILPKEFFAAFLDQSQLNMNVHGTFDFSFIRHDNNPVSPRLFMIDPVTNKDCIDLIHLFASLDGIYSNTRGCSFVVDTIFLQNEEKDLTSWAGDLQTGFVWFKNNNISVYNFSSFEEVMVVNGSCGEADIISDIDAYNLAFLELNYSNNLVVAFSNYYIYLSVNSANARYMHFSNNVLMDFNAVENVDNITKFSIKIMYLMCVKYENGTWTNHDNSLYIYTLLGSFDSEDYLLERIYLSNLFIQFIIDKVVTYENSNNSQ